MYNLKGLRKEVNKTQSEIAVLFGCKQNNISMQEKSDRDLTTEQMDVLRKNFGEEIVNKYHFGKVRAVVSGGKERYDSVWNGLKAVRDGMAGEEAKEGYVYIHDGARPFVDEEIIKRAYTCVEENRACVAGMPSKDTVKIVDENQFAVTTPARKYVWNVQTPQVFETALITQAYEKLMQHDRENVTDDAMVVEQEMQIPVKLFEGSYCNIKITTPEDLETAKGFIEHQ
mgnify:FL=1